MRVGGRQSLRDLSGEGGAGQHGNRRLRLRLGRDLGQQFHAARFYALRAENEGPVSLRKTAEQGPHMLGGRDDEQRVRPVKFAKVAEIGSASCRERVWQYV